MKINFNIDKFVEIVWAELPFHYTQIEFAFVDCKCYNDFDDSDEAFVSKIVLLDFPEFPYLIVPGWETVYFEIPFAEIGLLVMAVLNLGQTHS